MRHLKTGLVVAGVAVLALGACDKKSETTTTTATATTAGAPAADPAAVIRKAGLWEQTTTGKGLPTATSKICLGDSVVPCAGATVTKTADGYTLSATCSMGPNGSMKTEGTAKGDLASAYELTSTSTISGSPVKEMNQTIATTTKLKWLSTCPQGMNIGDQQLSDGVSIDMSGYDPAKAAAIAKENAAR